MKFKFTLLSVVAFLCSAGSVFGQSATTSICANNNSYCVLLRLTPTTIAAPTTCQFGYNYQVNLDYEISFTGSPPSNALNTLQGYLDCGTNTGIFFPLPLVPDTGTTQTTGNPYRSQSDCQTATPASLSCNSLEIAINGKQISNQRVTYATTPLPVEMQYLYIKTDGGLVDITWGTASEKDNDYFEVQRSLDGANWEAIGRVEGNGTTLMKSEYAFTDPTPYQGTSYYRLKQVDFDGTEDFSDVLVSKIGVNADLPTRIYPNPTKDKVTVEGVSLTENIQVLNAVGQDITGEISLNNSGRNVEIDLANVPVGIYFVQTASETYRIYKH